MADSWLHNHKNFIEGVFYLAISANFMGFWITFYQNIHQQNSLSEVSVDGYFFFYLGVIILSATTVLQLVRYYYEFQSFEYLLIAFMMYHMGFSFFLYQTYVGYFDVPLPEATEDSDMNSLGGYYYFIGQILILWHAIRIRDWKKSKLITRIVTIFLVYINVVIIFIGLEGALSSNPDSHQDFLSWNFEIFHYISDNDRIYLTIPTVLTYLFLIRTYFKIKVFAKNRVSWVTRVMWLVFGIVIIIQRITSDYSNQMDLTQDEVYRIWAVGTFVIMALMQTTLIIFPESLLMTENQILRAHNLYKIAKRSESMRSKNLLRFNYQQRVLSYLESLPEEFLLTSES